MSGGGSDGDGGSAFAHFKLVGERFEAEGMPTATAIEVDRFRQAVYAAALEIFLDRNPDRTTSPHGFNDAFDLRLLKVNEGSAEPLLRLNRPSRFQSAAYDPWYEAYDDGLIAVQDVLTRAAVDGEMPAVSPRVRARIRMMGRALQPSEILEVGESEQAYAEIDARTRAIIGRIDDELPPEPEQAQVEGVIIEFDSEGQSFFVRDGSTRRRIECRFREYVAPLAAQVRKYLAEDGVTAPDVLVTGQAHVDDGAIVGLVWDVESIEFVRSFGEKVAISKIKALRDLQPGWFKSNSPVPDRAILDELADLVPAIGSLDVPVALSPTEDGHVSLDWKRGDERFSAELESDGRLYLFVLHADRTYEDVETAYDRARLVAFMERGVLRG